MTQQFHPFGEYMKKEGDELTASMEDYLEMIARLSLKHGFVRINELSEALNVQPPSATRMVQKLNDMELIQYERYGYITLLEKGKSIGMALLRRHQLLEEFFVCLLVDEHAILEDTEKIEHTISPHTLKQIQLFITFMKENTDIYSRWKEFNHK